jgi:hypothetical protein
MVHDRKTGTGPRFFSLFRVKDKATRVSTTLLPRRTPKFASAEAAMAYWKKIGVVNRWAASPIRLTPGDLAALEREDRERREWAELSKMKTGSYT